MRSIGVGRRMGRGTDRWGCKGHGKTGEAMGVDKEARGLDGGIGDR